VTTKPTNSFKEIIWLRPQRFESFRCRFFFITLYSLSSSPSLCLFLFSFFMIFFYKISTTTFSSLSFTIFFSTISFFLPRPPLLSYIQYRAATPVWGRHEIAWADVLQENCRTCLSCKRTTGYVLMPMNDSGRPRFWCLEGQNGVICP
jgi:hypothetical protein